MIKFEALADVSVQRGTVELGQEIDFVEAAIQAIRNGDVHQPVFSGERYCRLRTLTGQREKASTLTATHDDAEGVVGETGRSRNGHGACDVFYRITP